MYEKGKSHDNVNHQDMDGVWGRIEDLHERKREKHIHLMTLRRFGGRKGVGEERIM